MNTLSKSATLLTTTSDFHCYLGELLTLHQEAVLLRKLALARKLFALFEDALLVHIEIEDLHFIPLLEVGKIKSQWPAIMYYKEHEKIQALTGKAGLQLDRLVEAQSKGAEQRRAVLEVLDFEKTLKGVLEHHEEREEAALLIDIDEQLGAVQLDELLALTRSRWQTLRQRQQNQLAMCRAELDAIE